MNPAIKRKQTLLVQWLTRKIQCKHVIAESGSQYLFISTAYTGKVSVRISDHLSKKPGTIHVIISSINQDVIINYENFMWSGKFSIAKHIVYTLLMTIAMPGARANMQVIKTPEITLKPGDTFEKFIGSWGKLADPIIKARRKHPELESDFLLLVKQSVCSKMDHKIRVWHQFKLAHTII